MFPLLIPKYHPLKIEQYFYGKIVTIVYSFRGNSKDTIKRDHLYTTNSGYTVFITISKS